MPGNERTNAEIEERVLRGYRTTHHCMSHWAGDHCVKCSEAKSIVRLTLEAVEALTPCANCGEVKLHHAPPNYPGDDKCVEYRAARLCDPSEPPPDALDAARVIDGAGWWEQLPTNGTQKSILHSQLVALHRALASPDAPKDPQ